jgi:5'-nucleotidase
MKKRLYIDMDDVMSDFNGAYAKALMDNPDVKYPQSQYGFFMNLEPIVNAVFYINKLRDIFDVWVLTRPSYKNPLCYTEKRVWIEKHFDLRFCQRLIICGDKSLLKGDFLVDDQLWADFEGEQIRFGKGYYQNWIDVYNYLVHKAE